jgi:two-component system sensor histidine kinase BaeS
MLTSIRSRLSLSHLVVLLIGMMFMGGLSWLAVESLYLETQRENLIAQAEIIASAMQDLPFPIEPEEIYLQTSNVAPGIHTRLLGEQGAVLIGLPLAAGETPVQVPSAENSGYVAPGELRARVEIQQALAGKAESAIRKVSSAENQRVLYAAAPVWVDGNVVAITYLATPLPPTRLPISLIARLSFAVFIAILLAGTAGRMLSSRLTRPLRRLDLAATSVSAGSFDQQVPVDSKIQELDNLGEAFNNMTASLQQADQAKTAFIADVTHELRTPLTVIKGTIETLEDGAVDDLAGRGELLRSMHDETDRLIRLVNDLLVLTRADADALNLDLQILDVTALAKTRCEQLKHVAFESGVQLEVYVEDQNLNHPLFVYGDSDRLAQVFDNLLDNAIRHAPPGTTVLISIQAQGNDIGIGIKDQGSGIPSEHLPLIFERFYRMDRSRNPRSGGSGLGLAIVKSFIQAHGGHIIVDSVVGKGTMITFWLPAVKTDTILPHN